jgi:hypothetical protein
MDREREDENMKHATCASVFGVLWAVWVLAMGWTGDARAAAPGAGGEDVPVVPPSGAAPPGVAPESDPGAADSAAPDEISGGAYELTIEAEESWATFRFEAGSLEYTTSCDLKSVRRMTGEVQISNELWISDDGIAVAGRTYPLDGLVVEDLFEHDDAVTIVLRRREPDGSGARGAMGRGRVGVGRPLRIAHDDFVRGDAICFGGDVTVKGEVNHDVVGVLGDVYVEPGGLVGGDVAAVDGRVSVRGDGRVRGEILTPHGRRISRHHRLSFDGEDWVESIVQGSAHYNRVDGLHLNAEVRAADADSVLPSLYAGGGYACVAKRWRYSLGARQRIGDRWAVALGGSFLRRTATDDDWISTTDEATCMALLVGEDMRDYYEEEGARGHVTFYPGGAGELGASYAYVQLDWMDSHPLLWSLFGGDKRFRDNFSSVPADERDARRGEFEGKLGEFAGWYSIDTRDDEIDPWRGWWGRLEYRQAGGDFKGDLEYKRFTAELRRFQPLGRRIAVNARVKYGTSDGELPLMRAFYLGGLRTIRGIAHKSLMGEKMILGNLEYVVETGLLDTRTAVFFDVGKTVPREEDLFADSEFASAVGLRLILDEDIHLEVAKSLNDTDEPVRVWAMFARTF